MPDALLLFLMILIGIIAVIFIPAYMTERAMVKVVRIFREHQADDIWSAKMPFELGLGPRGFLDRLKDPRKDYKPTALAVLLKLGIVRESGNGKLYLNEKALSNFCNKTENRMKVCSLNK